MAKRTLFLSLMILLLLAACGGAATEQTRQAQVDTGAAADMTVYRSPT